MEWVIGIVLVGGGLLWLLSRAGSGPAAAPGPVVSPPSAPVDRHVLDTVARRIADPNDPSGAFMDGYVAGRLTERQEWAAASPRAPHERQVEHRADDDESFAAGGHPDDGDAAFMDDSSDDW